MTDEAYGQFDDLGNDLTSDLDAPTRETLSPDAIDALSDEEFERVIAEARNETVLPSVTVQDGSDTQDGQDLDNAQQRAEMAVWAAYGAEYRAEMQAEREARQHAEADLLADPEADALTARMEAIEDLDLAAFLALAQAVRQGDSDESQQILRRAGASHLNLI